MDWQITGHKQQLELLERALRSGKLAHAYVFTGPTGVGKKTVAKKIARQLLDQHSDFHPDFLEISGDNGIKIEQIRELAYKLSLKPYQAKNKVALIDKADSMSIEAANALLKVLEEPKDYTFLFLISSNANKLPKTILSRCQKINFCPVEREKEQTEETILSEEYFTNFMSEKLTDRLIAAYDIADLETSEIKKLLESWLIKLEGMLLKNPEKSLAQKISEITISRRLLEQNVNNKLLLTNLMLNTA